jgi:tRNA dimethylallyltransferase
MHAELALVDPPTAARLAPADGQRIQRALEVWRLSGKALSDWHGSAAGKGADERALWPVVSLEPDDRAWLHHRVALRCDAMFAAGLVDEVRALRADPKLGPDLPSMRCVGYRQVWSALERGADPGLRTAVVTATRQLAKRQLTWLRAITERTVIACDHEDAPKRAIDTLMRTARELL